MLNFTAAKDVSSESVNLRRPNKSVNGETLGALTMLVLNRFMEQVKWDDIVRTYLEGLVDDEDLALIQRAVRALVDGGIEFTGVTNGD